MTHVPGLPVSNIGKRVVVGRLAAAAAVAVAALVKYLSFLLLCFLLATWGWLVTFLFVFVPLSYS